MYGLGGSRKRVQGFADGDQPSSATMERRRLSDLDFLAKLKVAGEEELLLLYNVYTRGWRRVAVARKLNQLR